MSTFECELCAEPRPDAERVDVLYDDADMSICPLCFEGLGGAHGVERILCDWRPRRD